MRHLSAVDFLVTLAEPTRLRILNCLAQAPLFVSDLVAILRLPQPTVSRHLKVLRELEVVRARSLPPRIRYELAIPSGAQGRLVRAVVRAIRGEGDLKDDRAVARERSRVDVG